MEMDPHSVQRLLKEFITYLDEPYIVIPTIGVSVTVGAFLAWVAKHPRLGILLLLGPPLFLLFLTGR